MTEEIARLRKSLKQLNIGIQSELADMKQEVFLLNLKVLRLEQNVTKRKNNP